MWKPELHDFSDNCVVPILSIALLGAFAASCSSSVPVVSGVDDSGVVGNRDAVGDAPATTVVNLPDSGWSPGIDSGICQPVDSCKVAGGQYCGVIGDGCTGNINCGDCPTGQSCLGGVCGSGRGYDAGALTSCVVTGGTYCGDIGNGAGGKLACGACQSGWTCTRGVCTGDPTICTPRSCGSGSSKYCGTIGDDCGHAKDCGGCAADQVCTNNQCVPATGCVAATCTPTGGQYCGGQLGDGCGSTITCGDCTALGWTCQDHLCKGGASCARIACGGGSGKYCDTIGDGCGGSNDCGACIAGEVCKNNQCMKAICTPLTCNPTGGQYCGGQVGDGCGGALDCSVACPAGWTCQNHLCVGESTCAKLTECTNGTPFNYCGDVGDNCGGVLHCGNDCASGQVCDASTGLCKGEASCVPGTCDNGSLFNYCGDVGDGCGGTLHCGNECDKGQTCDSTTNLCKGDATCVPVACDNGTPFKYCGENGNGCGGALHCGNDCDVHQVCGADGICKGDATCAPVTCTNGTPFSYCGDIGDGCGGAVKCGTRCNSNQVCGAEGLCKGNSTCVPRTCDNGTDFKYCGVVGDGCGGALSCGNNCGAGKVCDPRSNLCHGDTTCLPITSCDNGSDYHYCGTVGDGCGGSLVCSTTCGAGKTCDTTTGLCKGDNTCIPLAACSNGTAFNYCGTIGDGCGGSLTCSTACGPGKSCDTATGLCKGDNTCTPLASCSNGTAFNYCGTIGDGCGSTFTCSTHCGTGKTCEVATGLCKGDSSCTPLASCANGTAFNYCGTIGDGCGGSLACGNDCAASQICDTATGLCKGDSTCSPLAACTNGTAFNYCGVIGNGCGSSIPCSTDCGAGKVCDTSKGLCKGDNNCVPVVSATCAAAKGGTYCGGPIGDGCGGAITCPATCPTGFTCQNNACVCTSTSCGLCSGLQCQIARCDAGSTTISGKVYDPAGVNPLYNVIVYIPNTTLDPIAHGPTCDRCATPSGSPMAAALSGTDGTFTLTNVPSGTNIPIVFQVGKWRRQIKIPTVTPCQNNDLSGLVDTSSVHLTRLPRNINDGDAGTVSLPKIAITAGNAHPANNNSVTERLQCLLQRIGVSASEFTVPSGAGSISLYNLSNGSDSCNQVTGSTGNYLNATTNLWDSQAHLNQYDMVLLNCGGDESAVNPNNNNTFISHPGAVDRMKAYVNAGGRVFAEHFHWGWIKSVANYPSTFGEVATWNTSTGVIGTTTRDTLVDVSFPRGIAFANWLVTVGASTTNGHLPVASSVKATAMDQIATTSQRWIYEPVSASASTGAAQYTHYFSFNTPVGTAADSQCGRFVYTGLHVSDSASTGFPGDPATGSTFPGCCAARTALSAQEKALEFMIFDLSSCISNVDLPPPPIQTVPPPAAPPPPPPPAPPPPPSSPAAPAPPPAPSPPPPASPPPAPPASPPPPTAPAAPPPPPAPAPPAPPPPATSPPAPPSPPVPPPPPPPPPVAAPPPPAPAPPAPAPPPPPPPPPTPPSFIP